MKRPTALIVALIAAVLLLFAAAALAAWLATDRTRLQQQVLRQSLQALELRERLTRDEVALQEKAAALATRDTALAEATRPELPVRVMFRPAWMGQGVVATIRNVADQPLNVIAQLRDAKTSRDVSLALAANGSAEIGYAEGWTVTSGQSITVGASGYRSVTAFAP